jgi:hypothetical protein
MTSEVVPFEANQELTVARPPEIVLEEARRAAVALKEVIKGKEKPVLFNGEQYLEFEDWQTVGKFYGIAARTVSTNYAEFGGVKGWEATAVAVHVASQKIVSQADAMCLNDEPKWNARPKYEWHYVKKSGGTSLDDPGSDEIIWEKGKEGKSRPKKTRLHTGDEAVPLFQLRSMAQTRACAKAMRNALAWVVVLAGFRPTPAEELDGVIESHRQLHGAKDMGAAQVVEPTTTVEEIEAALKECGVDKAKLIAKTNGAEIADLDQENREKALAWIKKQKAKAA